MLHAYYKLLIINSRTRHTQPFSCYIYCFETCVHAKYFIMYYLPNTIKESHISMIS